MLEYLEKALQHPATCQRVEATDGWQHRLGPVTRPCFCNSTFFSLFGNYEVKRTLSENDENRFQTKLHGSESRLSGS